jgi:hypothetical protein
LNTPTDDNHSFDRWLRLAPWAAAILVGLCIIVLLLRISQRAGADNDSEESLTPRVEALPGQQLQQSSDSSARQASRRTDDPRAADPSGDAPTFEVGGRTRSAFQERANISNVASSGQSAASPGLAPVPPNSKGRVEIHGAGRNTLLGDPIPSSANPARVFPPHNTAPSESSSASAAADVVAGAISRVPIETGRAYTSLFGVEAEGRRFVYVFDRSGSMGEPANRPLQAAKEELLRSLAKLDGLHQFFLVFYNEEPRVFNAAGVRGRLVFATDENKKTARSFIDGIQAQGGTNHYEALLIAVRLRPDVIFVLTDGEQKDDLTGDELAHLKRLNEAVAQIHVIQFAGSPYASNSLAQLAQENRGRHTYLDIRKLNSSASETGR